MLEISNLYYLFLQSSYACVYVYKRQRYIIFLFNITVINLFLNVGWQGRLD